MHKLSIALLLALASLTACGSSKKSKCETYAEMEIKCEKIPASEAAMTRQLAEGMCRESEKEKSGMAQMFAKEAECAAKHTDCAAYKACTDAIKVDLK